jgi:magnesium-dependent phosphatase 1
MDIDGDDEPVLDMNDVMRRAVALKTERLRRTRASYEAAPPFVRGTLATDRDENYVELRKKPLAARVTFANKLLNYAKALVREQAHEDALEAYTDALAAFCHFERPSGTESTETLTYVDYLEDDERQSEGVNMVKRVMLNASACLMNIDLSKHAKEIEWATTQALRADNACATAYYRRGRARATMTDEEKVEQALNDFKRAVDLDRGEKRYVRALAEHSKEVAKTTKVRRAIFEKMFSSTSAIFDADEAKNETIAKNASDEEVDRVLRDENLLAKAREMGFDVDADDFRRELASRVREELHESRRERAEKLGLNLDDNDVKRAIEYFKFSRRDGDLDTRSQFFARFVVRALVVLIIARVVYVAHKLATSSFDSLDAYEVMD